MSFMSLRNVVGSPWTASGVGPGFIRRRKRTPRPDDLLPEALPDLVDGPLRLTPGPGIEVLEAELPDRGILEAAHPHPQQAHAGRRIEPVEELAGGLYDLGGDIGGIDPGVRPGHGREVDEPHLEGHRTPGDATRPEPPRHGIRLPDQLVVEILPAGPVHREGLFMAHGLDRLGRVDRTVVDAPRQPPEVPPEHFTEEFDQGVLGDLGQLAHRPDAEALQALVGSGAHTPDGRDGKSFEEATDLPGSHHEHADAGLRAPLADTRLGLLAGELRQVLVGGDADAATQPLLGADDSTNLRRLL